MVNTLPATPAHAKRSKVEGLKEKSNYLREPVLSELKLDTNYFSEDAIQILKFHGSYQQDNRDNRVKGQEKDYSMMLRTRSPGGYIPPELYLTLDRLSDTYGNGTLRATTRQGFQLHGILKRNLKASITEIVHSMGSTLGACGDLNRNVMAPPAPYKNRPEYQYALDYANRIADLLTPQSGAYYEIWLDGEKAISGQEHPEVKAARLRNIHHSNLSSPKEPIYGEQYLPRKFKIAMTVPGDNSVDVYTQDISLIVMTSAEGELEGFNVLVGGGLGRTHNKEETFVRAADPLGYVDKDSVYDLVKAIVATQRDYGDRTQRRHARMKYLVNDWGLEKFRQTVEKYFGRSILPYKALPEFRYEDFLGWQEQGDGKLFLGISVENGRVKDEGNFRLKTALKTLVEKFALPILLTPHQNVLLYDIQPAQRAEIDQILQGCGIKSVESIDPMVRYAMACPALPTCGLAVTESERAIPAVLDRIRTLLNRLGLEQDHFVVRMTGCPNGCARPYMAELGFVGITPETYQVWLGSSPSQTRLAQVYIEKLPIAELETFLEPLLVFFKEARVDNGVPESFGDFCHRVGFEALRNYAQTYVPAAAKGSSDRHRLRYRVNLKPSVFEDLKQAAQAQGRTLADIASDAIDAYLKQSQPGR
jgi:sulfite reductase (ferredoxin)